MIILAMTTPTSSVPASLYFHPLFNILPTVSISLHHRVSSSPAMLVPGGSDSPCFLKGHDWLWEGEEKHSAVVNCQMDLPWHRIGQIINIVNLAVAEAQVFPITKQGADQIGSSITLLLFAIPEPVLFYQKAGIITSTGLYLRGLTR